MKLPSSLLSLAVLCAAPAHATLVIYEGFTGYTTGAMGSGANTNPNANTVGLNTGTAFGGSGVGNYSYTGTGLTFGSLQTNGGAVTFNSSTAVLSPRTSFTETVTGTIYSSFLINFSTKGTGSGNGFESRLSNDVSTSAIRFRSFADSRAGTANEAAVSYGSGNGTNASTALSTGTTYLILSSFTNTGTAPTVTPGVATLYAFTLAQYESLAAAADKTTYLGNLTIGIGDTQVSALVSDTLSTGGALSLNSGSYAQFVSVGDVGTADELRWGTTLADVLIPEPSVSALAMIGAAFAGFRRRR